MKSGWWDGRPSISLFRSYEICPKSQSFCCARKPAKAGNISSVGLKMVSAPTATRHSTEWWLEWYWWLSRKEQMLNRLAQFNICFLNIAVSGTVNLAVVLFTCRMIRNHRLHRRRIHHSYHWKGRIPWSHHLIWSHHRPLRLSSSRRRHFFWSCF